MCMKLAKFKNQELNDNVALHPDIDTFVILELHNTFSQDQS